MQGNFSSKQLAMSGIIAAIYVVLTLSFAELSYYGIQFRISEILLFVVFIDPKISFGVLIGTFIANLMGPFGLIDAVFGTFVSGLALIGMYQVSKRLGGSPIALFLSGLFPTVINSIYVPVLLAAMDSQFLPSDYLPVGMSVAIGEFLVVSILGAIIFSGVIKNKELMKLLSKRS